MSRRSIARRFAFVLGAAAGISVQAGAQTQLYNFDGDKQYDRLGAAVANAGDFDNDGFNDIVVGAPEDFQVFLAGEGFVRVYSGLTGAVLGTFDGDELNDTFGQTVDGAGDVNNDGWDDIVVGAPYAANPGDNLNSGLVRVISGQTGAVLYSVYGAGSSNRMGHSVSAAGDVNNDGFDDFIGGAPQGNGNMGMIRVWSGANGTVLHEIDGSMSNGRLGYSVSDLGDVNNDGFDDFIAGSLFEGVKVFSGANGSVIHLFSAPTSDIYGKSVSSMRDINSDGVREILIGASQEDIFSPDTGYVEVRSGLTGVLLLTINGLSVNDRFGNRVDDCGDWNGDGQSDIMVTTSPSTSQFPSYVTIHSSVDGSLLATLNGDNSGDLFGLDIASLGDTNNDGKTEVVRGAPHGDPNGLASGYTRVFSSPFTSCGAITSYCSTSPNSVGSGSTISGQGSTSVSTNTFLLLSTGNPANEFGVFYYGANQVEVPFGDGFRCIGGQTFRMSVQQIGGSGSISLLMDFTNPPSPGGQILPNSLWNFQFWYRDPDNLGAGFNLSDAVSVSFCP